MIRVLFNKKGGVGKSSLTVNLAAIAANNGLKTLIIDLDTQCNSTQYLDLLQENQENTIFELFDQTISFHIKRKDTFEFCHKTQQPNLFIIPGSCNLAELESKLDSRHKIYKLRESLQQLKPHFDRIYIDTPPALNFYTLSALIGADSCIIPIDCDDFSRQGLYSLQLEIEEIKQDHNEKLKIEGIIANQFMAQAKLPLQIIDELKKEQFYVLNTFIPQSIKMKESHQKKKPLINYAPKHKLTQALVALHQELEAQ
ncbi:MAG: cobalamin biosynthesis protein CobQ [Gammaproteobacteria bacterium CG22_combo_CG10-13_8_21_14_all_40_8]|nr:MAG: cobalamin biosynthesis protein CobQ [Gammaproteobacteria bacterium CG22_combo_CG10-13_8_21_14_all_40_8]